MHARGKRALPPAHRSRAQDARRRRLAGVAAALAVVGLAVALYLALLESTGGNVPGGALLCGPGSACQANWRSPFARMGGLPLTAWGAGAYVALALLGWVATKAPAGGGRALQAGVALSWAGAVFSAYLVGVQGWVLRGFCPWCLTSAIVMTALAVAFTAAWRAGGARIGIGLPAAGVVLGAALAALNYVPASALWRDRLPGEELQAGAPSAAVRTLAQLNELLTVGSPGAPVLVEVYSDYQCPYCAQADRQVVRPLIQQDVAQGKMRLGYRNFAFIGSESKWAAEAAACAALQGQFWAFSDELFDRQRGENVGTYRQDRLLALAGDLGLDQESFRACLTGRQMRALVEASYDEGQRRGVAGTPTFFVNGRRLDGAATLEAIRRMAYGS